MSEEKPTFKVTDRRLFNADGTPRDIEREDEPVIISTPSATGDTTSSGNAASPARESARGPAPAAAQTGGAPSSTSHSTEEAGGASDPTGFVNLVMFIASPAAAALGMTEHPGMGAQDIDLPLAKHCIDLLGTIREKTRGNLNAQEQQVLEGLLAELRMQYVSLTTARPASGPRGFTGKDITGGK